VWNLLLTAHTVTLFVHWLYTQELPQDRDEWEQMDLVKKAIFPCENECMHVLIKAYALGDRLLAPAFFRAVNNLFAITSEGSFYYGQDDRRSITYAFENIPLDRVIIERLVEQWARRIAPTFSGYRLADMQDLPLALLHRTIHR